MHKPTLQTLKSHIRSRDLIKYLAFFLLICINLFIHIYKISSIPYGINVDEMGAGYDAWSLAHYGVDRYLKSFPVYLINFSGGQSALYAYLCAILIKLGMPLNILTIRIPIVVFSFVTLFFGIQIILLKYGRKMNYILAFTALYTACPIFLQLHRVGLDCNLMLGLSTVFLYTLMVAIEKPSVKHYLISGISCGLVLYTYALSYIVVPIFLLGMIIYIIRLHKITFKQFIAFTIPLAILAFPLILDQLVNLLDLPEITLGFLTFPKMYRYRSGDLVPHSLMQNLKLIFSVIFLHDELIYDTIPRYGTIYYFSIPFVLLGILHSIRTSVISFRERTFSPTFPILLWAVAEFLMGCSVSDAQSTHVNGIFIAIILLLIDGVLVCFHFIQKYSKTGSFLGIFILGAAYLISFLQFTTYYFGSYTDESYLIPYFNNPLYEPLDYLENTMDDKIASKTTYIGNLEQTYIYYLAATLTSPYDYNQLEIEDSQHLLEWTSTYQNFNFNLPEEIDMNANYIIQDKDVAYLNQLKENHFTLTQTGHYYVCTSNWETYTNDENALSYTWNSGINSSDTLDTSIVSDVNGTPSIVVVGWAYNANSDTCWDDVFLTIGTHTYHPEIVSRDDVVEEHDGNTNLQNSGLLFIIPQADLAGVDQGRFVCIDNQNKIKSERSISIQ